MADRIVIGARSGAVQRSTMRIALVLALVSAPAFAQEGIRPSDNILDHDQMTALLTGNELEFYDGSKSRYGDDGSYGYTYTDNGPVWTGHFEVFDESRVCVDFDNGSRRCDIFIQTGDQVVLVTADGTRFPVRNLTVYHR